MGLGAVLRCGDYLLWLDGECEFEHEIFQTQMGR